MTASLASFQSDLGRALLGEDVWPIDSRSAGFRFTMKVRRSWCEGRSTIAAREVLDRTIGKSVAMDLLVRIEAIEEFIHGRYRSAP